jgi:deoxyribodipyrimidine photolyase-related protein
MVAMTPLAAFGVHEDAMRDYCGDCRHDPETRVGPDACPFTAGYWNRLDRSAFRSAATGGCHGH